MDLSEKIDLTNLEKEDGWRTITNKFESKCCVCGGKIGENTQVFWKKGKGIRHTENCNDVELVTETVDLIIDEDDGIEKWIDERRRSLEESRKITECQRCGKTLDKTKDTFINDGRRTCEGCIFKW